jgi:hypothetical protein
MGNARNKAGNECRGQMKGSLKKIFSCLKAMWVNQRFKTGE